MKKAVLSILAALAAFAMVTAGCRSPTGESGSSVVFTVTFDMNNDDAVGESPVTMTVSKAGSALGALPETPTWIYGEFVRWNTEPDGSSGYDFTAGTPVNGNITVYAIWDTFLYTVNFNYNRKSDDPTAGWTQAVPATRQVNAGENIVLPRPPTRSGGWNAGMTFDSWNTDPDGKGTVFTPSTLITDDMTVYAQWKFSAGEIKQAGSTIVHDAPQLATSPTTQGEQGTFRGTVNNDGSVTFYGGAVRYKFPYDDLNDYDFLTIDYVSKSTGTPFKVICKQYDTSDNYPVFGANQYRDLAASGSLTFAILDAGTSLGLAMQFNGGATNGTIKFTKVTFKKGIRHTLSFMQIKNGETKPLVNSIGDMDVTEGIAVVLPTAGSDDDDSFFIGWTDDPKTLNPFTNASTANIKKDTTLYAQWFPKGNIDPITSFDSNSVQGRGSAFTSANPKPIVTPNSTDNGYTLTYGGSSSNNEIGYANTWVKFNITIPNSGHLIFYNNITFTIQGNAGDSTYKPVYVLAGDSLGTGELNYNAPANLLAPSQQYTSGSQDMKFIINQAVASSMKGTLEVAIYIHAANYSSSAATKFTISNIKFNPESLP